MINYITSVSKLTDKTKFLVFIERIHEYYNGRGGFDTESYLETVGFENKDELDKFMVERNMCWRQPNKNYRVVEIARNNFSS